MTRQFASRLSLIAFTTSVVRGVLWGADFEGTIKGALLALAVFYALGGILGELARLVVEESIQTELERLATERASQESTE